MHADARHANDTSHAFTGAAVAAALTLPLFVFLAWKTRFTGLFSDSAIYILLADAFFSTPSSFDWQTFLFERYPFPPLYPLVLAVLGGGSNHVVWTHALGAITSSLYVGAMMFWLRRESVPWPVAMITTGVTAVMPISLFCAMDAYSEPLYLLLTLVALGALVPQSATRASWYTAAGCIGLAALVRSVGVTAIAAMIVTWWFATAGKRYRAAPFIALAPTLAWAAFKWVRDYDSSYVLTLVRFPLSETVPALFAELPDNLDALVRHGRDAFDILGLAPAPLLLALPLACALAGFIVRLRERRFDAFYLGAYLGLIMIWPHGQHADRFLFVVVPIVGFHAYCGASIIACRLRFRHARGFVRAAPAILTGLLVLPSAATIVSAITTEHGGPYRDAARTGHWYTQPDAASAREDADIIAEMTAAIRTLGRAAESGSCITSIYPQTTMLLTGHPSLFPAAPDAPPAEFERSMRQCPYILVLNATAESFGFPGHFYPRGRMGDRFELVAEIRYAAVTPAPAVAAMLAHYRDPEP